MYTARQISGGWHDEDISKKAFQLSDSGAKGLVKSIWSFFLYYVSFVPPMICVFLFADRLLHGNTGKPVVYLLFMLVATLVMYLVINYNYKTTYDETYQESANLRIDLAEQLSKLPLSYFQSTICLTLLKQSWQMWLRLSMLLRTQWLIP